MPVPLRLLILSVSITLFFNIWQFQHSFSLWDEGFFWYGVQQVMKGAVPLRDFMAYDPGRYYSSAAVMALLGGDGLLSLRWTMALFEAAVVYGTLLLIYSASELKSLLFWLLAALTLLAWLQPYFKMHDFLACVLLLGGLADLARNGRRTSYFTAGVCVGFATVLGRNHGVYGLIGSLGLMVWLAISRRDRSDSVRGLLAWCVGVAAGFAPMLLLMAVVPGFTRAFWASVLSLLQTGATPLALPVPWPWRVNFATSILGFLRSIAIGLGFVAILVFGVLSVPWVVLQRVRGQAVPAAFVAASFLALPYVHYAYTRADVVHLCLGILPFLVGLLVITADMPKLVRLALASVICAGSLLILLPQWKGYYCERKPRCIETEISGSKFIIDAQTASDIRLLRNLAAQYAPAGRPFLAVPYWPGAYAVLNQPSPVWEIYGLVPVSAAFEQAEIERLKAANPGFVVVNDGRLDGREDGDFQHTHSRINHYITENFDQIPDPIHPTYRIFKSRHPSSVPQR